MRDYIELTKPRITWLILMSTGIGFYFGHSGAKYAQMLREVSPEMKAANPNAKIVSLKALDESGLDET